MRQHNNCNTCNNNNSRGRQALLALSILSLQIISSIYAFQSPSTARTRISARKPTQRTQIFITLDKEEVKSKTKLVDTSHINGNISIEPNILDLSSYETSLLSSWEDPRVQRGFDWEIEKARRHFAGLRQNSDGVWVRKSSVFEFLVTNTPQAVVSVDINGDRYEAPPQPVNIADVVLLVVKNLLNGLGFGPYLGMAAVPDAVIEKYEGSFFSFIKGALGGDLQTLAGGPLFLLLEKYYNTHGPIFNLSFGPKSFLIISDPVMAKHILRDSSPEQYCKGILADILEPIMGDGLIPADPKIWKVSYVLYFCFGECANTC